VVEIANDTIVVICRYRLNDPTEGASLGHSLGFKVVERSWFSAPMGTEDSIWNRGW
jgi:hypothetical protein